MKNLMVVKVLILLTAISAISAPLYAEGGQEKRNYYSDVEREKGKSLTQDEKKIVDSVFIFYNSYYGYSVRDITAQQAANNMNQEQYTNTIRQSVKISSNKATKGILATGKAGEKLLKAIIISTEEAAKAAGTWINNKSTEYDNRNK